MKKERRDEERAVILEQIHIVLDFRSEGAFSSTKHFFLLNVR